MLMSSRRDPPKPIPLSKVSKQQHLSVKEFLLHSPLPSPSLPSILPRHGKKPPRLNPRKIIRALLWLALGTTVLTLVRFLTNSSRPKPAKLTYQPSSEYGPKSVADQKLPENASPIVVVDSRGRSSWTMSIPTHASFPLAGSEYAAICTQADEISIQIAGQKMSSLRYKQKDTSYVDILRAQQAGHLPKSKSSSADVSMPVCSKSLTYILDATEAGLGKSLLGMWISYSLARRENRAFFVDDTYFTYGKYSSLFAPSTETPTCRPPPWEQRTPCPRQADHLVVSVATFLWSLGGDFVTHFNTKEVFRMAREGYEALFHLRPEDETYVQSRLKELRKGSDHRDQTKIVGVHMRRGDLHPFEFQYQHGYLPPSKYMDVAQAAAAAAKLSTVVLASDDADIYHHPELKGTVRAQEQIRLASNKQLNGGGLGWEGGFFRDAFWGIGIPDEVKNKKPNFSPQPTKGLTQQSQHQTELELKKRSGHDEQERERNYRSHPTPQALQLREYIARAYLLDLAVLAGSDEVVCGVSSRGCRMLGVMMGWDKVSSGKWKNVDGHYGWRGIY